MRLERDARKILGVSRVANNGTGLSRPRKQREKSLMTTRGSGVTSRNLSPFMY